MESSVIVECAFSLGLVQSNCALRLMSHGAVTAGVTLFNLIK